MIRGNSSVETGGEALDEYRRAKQVWQALARKQRENGNPRVFRFNREFLQDLGFGQEDFDTNVRDLQRVLATLHEFTWHWDRSGPLSPPPGTRGSVAYIADGALVIGSQFWEARKLFVTYGR
jgi:hypothetical protein